MTHVDDLRPELRGIDDTCDEVSDISSILPSIVDNLKQFSNWCLLNDAFHQSESHFSRTDIKPTWVADNRLLNSLMFFIVRLLIFVFTPIAFDEIGLAWTDFRSYVSKVKRSKVIFIF